MAHRLLSHRPPRPLDVHPMNCDCAQCDDAPATGLTALDVVSFQIIAGVLLGILLCEVYALLTGGPHVSVLIGGNG